MTVVAAGASVASGVWSYFPEHDTARATAEAKSIFINFKITYFIFTLMLFYFNGTMIILTILISKGASVNNTQQ